MIVLLRLLTCTRKQPKARMLRKKSPVALRPLRLIFRKAKVTNPLTRQNPYRQGRSIPTCKTSASVLWEHHRANFLLQSNLRSYRIIIMILDETRYLISAITSILARKRTMQRYIRHRGGMFIYPMMRQQIRYDHYPTQRRILSLILLLTDNLFHRYHSSRCTGPRFLLQLSHSVIKM